MVKLKQQNQPKIEVVLCGRQKVKVGGKTQVIKTNRRVRMKGNLDLGYLADNVEAHCNGNGSAFK